MNTFPGARVMPAPTSGALAPTAAVSGSTPMPNWVFYGFLALLFIEYTGLPYEIPIIKTLRVSTFLTYGLAIYCLAKGGARGLLNHPQYKIFIGFVVFTMLSIIWAVVRTRAFNEIQPLIDYMAVGVTAFAVMDRKQRRDALGVICAIIATIIVLRNLDKLGSAPRLAGLRAGYFLGDNNDFAWGLMVMLPIVLSLLFGERGFMLKFIGLVGLAMCVFGIVGSGSRGGTLGLSAAFLYFLFFVTPHKGATVGVLVLGLVAVLIFAPGTYFKRIESIGSYEQDSSAQARLQVWGAATNMAIDHPLGVGAGNFQSAYGRYYMASEDKTRIAWSSQRWLGAHSIYFRVLGEFGFIGLSMLLSLLYFNIRDNHRARAKLAATPGGNINGVETAWPGLVATSLVGFAVCSIFLGGLTYPHIFILTGITLRNKMLVTPEASAPKLPAWRRK